MEKALSKSSSISIKPNLAWIFKITISVFLILYLIHISQFQVGLLFNILYHPFGLIFCVLLFLLMVLVNAWRWRLLNCAQDIQLSLLKTSCLTYLGTAFNNILPGNVGGDFVRGYYLFQSYPQQKSQRK